LTDLVSKLPKTNGTPKILVVAGAALRVADLCRDLRPLQTKGSQLAKLFAKHIKLSEHIDFLQKTKVIVAVGTPGRIAKLLSDTDALSVDLLSHIVLDASYLDTKKRNVLDMPDGREDLFRNVLGHPKIMSRLKTAKTKVVIY